MAKVTIELTDYNKEILCNLRSDPKMPVADDGRIYAKDLTYAQEIAMRAVEILNCATLYGAKSSEEKQWRK